MQTLRNVRIEDDQFDWLDQQAEQADSSLSAVIRELIEDARSGPTSVHDDEHDAAPARIDRLSERVDALEAGQSAGEYRTREAAAVDATDVRLDTVSAIVEATAGTLDVSPVACDRVREIVHAPDDPDALPDGWDASELDQEVAPGGLKRVVALAAAYDYLQANRRVTTGALIDDVYPRASGGFAESRYRKFVRYVAALPEVTAPSNGQQEWHFHADRAPDGVGSAER